MNELELLKSRLREQYLMAAPPDVLGALRSLQLNGAWPKLDYQTEAIHTLYSIAHCRHLDDFARAYAHLQSPLCGDVALLYAMQRALNFWLHADPKTQHGWSEIIGVPRHLLAVLVLAEDVLPPDLSRRVLDYLRRPHRRGDGFREDGEYWFHPRAATGQNLQWLARIQMEIGILTNDAEKVRAASSRILQEITLTLGEGLQPDNSFHQHGAQLYSGGYGASFTIDGASLAALLHKTSFAWPDDKIELLARHVLDGQQWMTRGSEWDFGVVGREVSRWDKTARTLSPFVEMLAEAFPSRAKEARAFAARLNGKHKPEYFAPGGNRSFWRSDYMAHSRAEYFASVRMNSSRVLATECGNNENELSALIADGALCLMQSGQEYSGLYPLWNWRQVPGITAVQSTRDLPQRFWGNGARGLTDFAGSLSEGNYGFAAFEFHRNDAGENLRARKSWFFFDDEIVCLGAGISCDEDVPVYTTIDQCWRSGARFAFRGEEMQTLRDDETLTGNYHRLWHARVGYVFPGEQKIGCTVERREGEWSAINRLSGNGVMASGEVFSLWLDHGVRPRDAEYSYTILPAATVRKVERYKPLPILRNSSAIQAVAHPQLNIVMAAFYEPGELRISDDEILAVDAPCLMLKRGDRVLLSNPTNQPARIFLHHQRGAHSSHTVLEIPAAEYSAGVATTDLETSTNE